MLHYSRCQKMIGRYLHNKKRYGLSWNKPALFNHLVLVKQGAGLFKECCILLAYSSLKICGPVPQKTKGLLEINLLYVIIDIILTHPNSFLSCLSWFSCCYVAPLPNCQRSKQDKETAAAAAPVLDTVTDFLIKLGMKSRMHLVEISIFH